MLLSSQRQKMGFLTSPNSPAGICQVKVTGMKYRMYVDEVGNADLDSSDDPNHRFLSLTGVIVELGHVEQVIHPQMEALKRSFFRSHPDEPVILHRRELIQANHPFEPLRDASIRKQFDHQLLTLLESWQYAVISVCLDKKKHKETYTVWRYDPYHYCLAVMLERYAFLLQRRGSQGDVMAESRGGREDRRLKDSFTRLWERGTDYVAPDLFRLTLTSKQLKVKAKTNNIAGLQLADLIAHSCRDEILNENGLLEKVLTPFSTQVIEVLQGKYNQLGGRVAGIGKKFI